jgi:hypothetical protein
MSSTTLLIQRIVLGTRSVPAARCCDICLPIEEDNRVTRTPVRARWAVTTDENGNRRLAMCWRVEPQETK